jgi:hypothetical protein
MVVKFLERPLHGKDDIFNGLPAQSRSLVKSHQDSCFKDTGPAEKGVTLNGIEVVRFAVPWFRVVP